MGGKGQRRREKNYRAAHGGYARLPPPPKPSEIDALPSKLRRLMDFTSPKTTTDPSKPSTTTSGSSKVFTDKERKGKKRGVDGESKPISKDVPDSKTARLKEKGNDEKVITPKHKDSEDESSHMDKDDKRRAKKKRKQVNDLRFDTTLQGSTGLKRKERKKKYLEAKKNKHKKVKTEESLDFPGHEKIKFGEVVEAPPKLLAVPKLKALKTVPDASHERLRLQAVEAYRNRKKWVSRPGIQIPTPIVPDPSL